MFPSAEVTLLSISFLSVAAWSEFFWIKAVFDVTAAFVAACESLIVSNFWELRVLSEEIWSEFAWIEALLDSTLALVVAKFLEVADFSAAICSEFD